MIETALMARQEKRKPAPGAKKDRRKDRHKPRTMVGIRDVFIGPLNTVARRLGHDKITPIINDAVREFLERHHCWPPPENTS